MSAAARGRLRDDDWLRGFGGGLVATCGLRNVGVPSEGHGLHGEISHQPARDVRVERWVDGERALLSASGAVAEVTALGHRLELERTWTTRTGEGRLELVDVTRNLGPEPEPAPLLYHVNLGAPLWSAGATLALDARGRPARRGRGRALGPRARPSRARASASSSTRSRRRGRLVHGGRRLAGPACGSQLRWEAAALPRLHQWVHPAPGIARARPRAGELLGPRPRRRPRRGPPARARARRGARHAPRGQRRGTLGGLGEDARDSSRRLRTPTFSKTDFRWSCTVWREMNSRPATRACRGPRRAARRSRARAR